jgi:glutathione S-transferase
MAKLKLYGVPMSRAFRVMWCLKELGVDYENVAVGTKPEAMPAEYRAVNPMLKVPAIDDAGFVLTESAAINLYLARKYGAGKLWPAAAADQARAEMWAMWAMTECEQNCLDVAIHRVRLPPEQRVAATADKAEKALANPLRVLEAQLKANGNVLGPAFTIADLVIASVLFILTRAPFDWTPYPTVKRWLDNALARPAAAAAIKLREG